MRATFTTFTAILAIAILLAFAAHVFGQAAGGGGAAGGGATAGGGTAPGAGASANGAGAPNAGGGAAAVGGTQAGSTDANSANGGDGFNSVGSTGTASSGPGAAVPYGSGTATRSSSLFQQQTGARAAGNRRLGTLTQNGLRTGTTGAGAQSKGRRFSNQNQGMFQNDSRTNTGGAVTNGGTGRPLGTSAVSSPRQSRDARLMGDRQAANLVEQSTANQSAGPVPTAAQTLQSTTTTVPEGRRLFIDNAAANAVNSQAAVDASAATAQQNARAAARASNPNLSTDNVTQPASSANGARSDDLHDFSGPSAAATVTNSAASQLRGANTNVPTGTANAANGDASTADQPLVSGVDTVVSPFAGGAIVVPGAANGIGTTNINSNGTVTTRTFHGTGVPRVDGTNAPVVGISPRAIRASFAQQLGVGFDAANQNLILAAVTGGSWADRVGLRQGDRIVSIGGQTVNGFSDLASYVQANPSGRTTIDVERNGQVDQLQLHLGNLTRPLQVVDPAAVTSKGRRIAGTAAEAVRAARIRAEQAQPLEGVLLPGAH